MKVTKSGKNPEPKYPSSRQMTRLLGTAVVGLASATVFAADQATPPPPPGAPPANVRLDGDIAVEPRPQPPTPPRTVGKIAAEPRVQPPGGIKAPQPASTNAVQGVSHTVKQGETLSSIAQRYLGDANRWKEIADLNPGIKPEALKAGDVLVIPQAAITRKIEPVALGGLIAPPPAPKK